MKDITSIDKNFIIKSDIEKDDIRFYNVEDKPFKVYGIFKEDGKYRRMPGDVAKNITRGIDALHTNTAGGRVRFKTDSQYVAVHAEMEGLIKLSHFALTGSVGFDLYVGNKYNKTFVPPFDTEDGFEGIMEFPNKELREITINFPLYSGVNNLYVGLQNDATIEEASPYKNTKPVVYYGSSITQGACASRPGMAYQSILSRRFNLDFVNLGFSGSARAQDGMIEYIKNLDMSVFVYDYDYNAPTVEHLENTHEKMFKEIRKENPDIPIIIMSRPAFYLTEEEEIRRSIIEKTYKNAISSNDTNVYFIDGRKLMELCEGEGTVDNCHPTDFGFVSIANALSDIFGKLEENIK